MRESVRMSHSHTHKHSSLSLSLRLLLLSLPLFQFEFLNAVAGGRAVVDTRSRNRSRSTDNRGRAAAWVQSVAFVVVLGSFFVFVLSPLAFVVARFALTVYVFCSPIWLINKFIYKASVLALSLTIALLTSVTPVVSLYFLTSLLLFTSAARRLVFIFLRTGHCYSLFSFYLFLFPFLLFMYMQICVIKLSGALISILIFANIKLVAHWKNTTQKATKKGRKKNNNDAGGKQARARFWNAMHARVLLLTFHFRGIYWFVFINSQ